MNIHRELLFGNTPTGVGKTQIDDDRTGVL